MKTISISSSYHLKWQIKFATNYKITTCKKIINTKSGRILKKVLNGYSLGYWIGKKFIPISEMNKYCEHIEIINCPF